MKDLSNENWTELQSCMDRMYMLLGFDVHATPLRYEATGKQQIADAAHVSTRRLYEWMNASPHRERLAEMGITSRTKLLHPRAVAYVCEQFGITL